MSEYSFAYCTSLTHLKLPSIINIKLHAFFDGCKALIDIELSERLESIEAVAFLNCERLQRIAIPLKGNLFACLVMSFRDTASFGTVSN